MTPTEQPTEAQRNGTPSPLVDTIGAARYIGIAAPTLETWRCTGRVKIKFVRVGRCVKYRLADLDAFLESQTTVTGGQ